MENENKLQELTPEKEAKIPQYIAKAVVGVFDGGRYKDFNPDKAREAVEWNYTEGKMKPPMMLVVSNPFELQMMTNILCLLDEEGKIPYRNQEDYDWFKTIAQNALVQLSAHPKASGDFEKYRQKALKDLQNLISGSSFVKSDKVDKLWQYNNMHLITLNVNSDAYYQWYMFLCNEFGLKIDVDAGMQKCFGLQRESCVYSATYMNYLCIVCKYPKRIHVDANNNLHNPLGPAFDWDTTTGLPLEAHYIHGRNFPRTLFEKVVGGEYTKEDFTKETNEDTKGIVYSIKEAQRSGSMLEFLGASEFHRESIVHKNGRIEEAVLFRTKEKFSELRDLAGNTGVPLCWLQMECPTTGTKYLVATDPSFKKAGEALKYHRPSEVPITHPYSWASAN